MLNTLAELTRPMLLALDPEWAHELTLKSLEAGFYPRGEGGGDARLIVAAFGLEFPNPLGIAAGFDKDARVPDAILDIGFGFAEVGTLTPEPQSGNPTPRVFRLVADRAVINRLGFNNGGHAPAIARLERRGKSGIVGVNIGAGRSATDRAADYVLGVERFHGLASYLAINVSSPNTPGLRDLQAPAALDELLGRVMAARSRLVATGAQQTPIIVKLAPDIAEGDLEPICARLMAHAVDGIALTNTTLARPKLRLQAVAREGGGLSGRPLFHRSTVMLARVHQLTQGRVPLIGIGGIESGETALAKIEAGASLLQLYTGLIYEGPGLIGRIKRHLSEAVTKVNVGSIAALTGRKAAEWAARPLDA